MVKKGQSLVEVVVSLSIVATVFATTVTLVVSVFNLSVSSRNLTEAVAISQRAMSEVIEDSREGCTRKKIDENLLYTITESTANYEIWGKSEGIIVGDGDAGNPGEITIVDDAEFESAPFVLFTITSKWEFRNKDYEYKISQLIKK